MDRLLGASPGDSLPARDHAQLCGCGCGQAVVSGRKYVNQAHYNQSKGLTEVDAEQLLSRFLRGAPVLQLAREYGVAHSTVYRLFRKMGLE